MGTEVDGIHTCDSYAMVRLGAWDCQASGEAAKGEELLKQLADRFQSLKWSSRSFAALSRVRIFPAIAPVAPVRSDAYPPRCASVERVAVSLDAPCTLFQHASVAWTQLALLHPDTFDKWPKPLLQRFSAIKDTVWEEIATRSLSASFPA